VVARWTVAILLIVAFLSASVLYALVSPAEHGKTTSTSATGSSQTTLASTGGDWTTYHRDNSRSGFIEATSAIRASLVWRSEKLDGKIYAEPLLFKEVLFVATENDSVYALNASTGSVIWRENFGAPVRGSDLPCGNIDPSGITGTPVIDPKSGTLFAVAFLRPAHHVLYAISLGDGAVRFSGPVDAPGADPRVEQQRAALTLANGMVYVPYGGLYGDCGQYHGWVVGVHADGSPGLASYMVPTQREGGIWAPSGATVDSAGNLFVATGNGQSSTVFDHGNSVVKLSSSLSELEYFAPSNWASLSSRDQDLGSVGPALVGGSSIFQIGKEGVAYLLNASDLGGIGGEQSSVKVCGSAFGGTAFDGTAVYAACTDGLVQVRLQGNRIEVGWKAPGFQAGPPIVTGGVVWSVDTSSGRLLGFAASDGSQLFSFDVGASTRFCTPAAGAGAVYVAPGDIVYAFANG